MSHAPPLTAKKQIKRWRRSKKLALIRRLNPSFKELSLDESA
jgi:predicted GIY-YIG superfamily endonuclease